MFFRKFFHFVSIVQFIGIKLFLIFPYCSFDLCKIFSDVTFSISDIVILCSLTLFLLPTLQQTCLRFINFLCLFKEPNFGFVNFFLFLVSYLSSWFLLLSLLFSLYIFRAYFVSFFSSSFLWKSILLVLTLPSFLIKAFKL